MTQQISILSGKGGAGKTSVTAAIIKQFSSVVAVDADVNASNLPLLLPHQRQSEQDYFGMDSACIDRSICTNCGLCYDHCRFDAISRDPYGMIQIEDECEGCALCLHCCPHQAISMQPHRGGQWYLSQMQNGTLVHADLIPGEDNSGKLITQVRNAASTVAKQDNIPYIVIDGPPGTSCQAISSISGCNLVLAVVEESLSGLSDYRRLAELINKFSIPHLVLINKAGFDDHLNEEITRTACDFGGKLIGRIPFDQAIPRALEQLQTLADMPAYGSVIRDIVNQITATLEQPSG